MSFIGIITNPKNEEYMTKILSESFSMEQIIFINDKNIENIKNIKFETVVIDYGIKHIKDLKAIISKAKNIIINSDLVTNLNLLENLDLMVISYGFNNKATFSVSSVSERSTIICLQRVIRNIFGERYDPQEIEIENDENIDMYAIICVYIILIMYKKYII